MSTIFHVMREEYDRLVEADQAYRNNIQQMPHGSPRIKHIRNRDYLYLARRNKAKVVYDYIGAVDSELAKKLLSRCSVASGLRDYSKTFTSISKT